MKVHHIGIAVNSLEREKFWNQFLNLETEEYKEIPDQKVKIAFISVGETKIELLEPLGEGAVSKFLEKRGEGIHHIALQVDDIEGVLAEAGLVPHHVAQIGHHDGVFGLEPVTV